MAQFIVDLMRSWLTPQAPFFDLPPFSICTMALLRNDSGYPRYYQPVDDP